MLDKKSKTSVSISLTTIKFLPSRYLKISRFLPLGLIIGMICWAKSLFVDKIFGGLFTRMKTNVSKTLWGRRPKEYVHALKSISSELTF